MMKRIRMALGMAVLVSLSMASVRAGEHEAKEEAAENKAAAAAVKANVGLYPNDFGPAEIDVSGYPKEMRMNYKVFAFKCAACHTIARPINSQFLELSAEEQAALKKTEPELFTNKKVWTVEDKIWNRYVKRMMTKPGCPVQGEDGKKIWQFLAYDSKVRKTGANREAWKAQREKMISDFKRDYHEAYENVFHD